MSSSIIDTTLANIRGIRDSFVFLAESGVEPSSDEFEILIHTLSVLSSLVGFLSKTNPEERRQAVDDKQYQVLKEEVVRLVDYPISELIRRKLSAFSPEQKRILYQAWSLRIASPLVLRAFGPAFKEIES